MRKINEILVKLKKCPLFDGSLERGEVSKSNIVEIEKKLGVKLPLDFVTFYLDTNGFKVNEEINISNMDSLAHFQTVEFVYDLQYILKDWESSNEMNHDWTSDGMNDLDNPVATVVSGPMKGYFWTSAWIPFAYSGTGSYCLDFDPLDGGKEGQIIFRDVYGDENQVVAVDFSEWLIKYFDLAK